MRLEELTLKLAVLKATGPLKSEEKHDLYSQVLVLTIVRVKKGLFKLKQSVDA